MTRKGTFPAVAFILFVFIFATCAHADNATPIKAQSSEQHLTRFYLNANNIPQDLNQDSGFLLAQAAPDASTPDDDFDDFDDEFGDDMEKYDVPDPLYYFNYAMYGFNDFFYLYLLEPIATGYEFVVPTPVRSGFKNFFHNLLFPVRLVNNLLQFELTDAGKEVGIFVVNTTTGVLGIGQVAQNSLDWHTEDEDLGQTFGAWGIDEGFYLVWPLLGPSSLRDSIGLVGDSFLTPVNYVEPWELSLGIKVFDTINAASFRLGDYKALVDSAIDPYAAIKNAYIQTRQGQVKK